MTDKQLHSENINEISSALSKAQSEIQSAGKDGINPHFKSNFASLHSHWMACKDALGKNNLMVTQLVSQENDKNILVTILSHSSGQWFKSYYPLNPVKNDPQGMGSCITYARRYMLSSIIGTTANDDDGEDACGHNDMPKSSSLKKDSAKSSNPEPLAEEILNHEQLREIIEGLSQVDDTFKTNYKAYMQQRWKVSEYNNLPISAYVPTIQGIKNNIEMNKKKSQAV